MGKSCEQFFFDKIAPAEATPDDYRAFFALLWETHGQTVYLHSYSRLNNVENARDVCQDTFVRAMEFIQKNPGRIPLKVNFLAWLRKIATNLINDRFRDPLTRIKQEADEDRLDMTPVEQPPEARAIAAEDLSILRECLKALTERARNLVVLHDLEGMKEKDVAARLNLNANAVYVALHRARKSLRECVTQGKASERD